MIGEIIQKTFFGNRVLDYAIWLGVLSLGLLVIYIFKEIIVSRLKKWAEGTETKIDDFAILHVQKTLMPLMYWGAFALSIRYLTLPQLVLKGVGFAWMFLATFLGARFVIELVEFGVHDYLAKKKTTEDKIKGVSAILIFVKVAIGGCAIFLLLDNVGIKISALIAGLGIGGIAVALAAQAFLGDIFSFVTILFDRPFETGDFIVFNNESGFVEHIGIKTTRIRSIGGEQIIVSNTNLTNALVHNYKRMNQRRVVLNLGVTYQTPNDQLKAIPPLVKGIIEKTQHASFDRAHFSSFGDSSLNFEVVYFVSDGDYNKYMDTQQEINFTIKEEFDKRKIDFAYPTQTVFLSK